MVVSPRPSQDFPVLEKESVVAIVHDAWVMETLILCGIQSVSFGKTTKPPQLIEDKIASLDLGLSNFVNGKGCTFCIVRCHRVVFGGCEGDVAPFPLFFELGVLLSSKALSLSSFSSNVPRKAR